MQHKSGITVAMLIALAGGAPAIAQTLTGNIAVLPDHSMSARRLIGERVYDEHSHMIGTVVDVLMKPQGEPSVILAVGAYLGHGKMIEVPLSHIRLDCPKAMMPGATKRALAAMPTFDYRGGSS